MNFYRAMRLDRVSKQFGLVLLPCLFWFTTIHAQFKDTSFHIQYPIKGYVLLGNNEKVSIRGINFYNSDSIILFQRGTENIPTVPVYKNITQLKDVKPRLEPISNMTLIKDNRNAYSKGAFAGALLGFGLGYIVGYGSYEDKQRLTPNENDERRKNKGSLYGVMGAVPVGVTGALLGGIILRKRFKINGSKERLATALQKIY